MRKDSVAMFGTPPQRIDLLSDITGVDFDAVWAGSKDILIDSLPIRLIGLAELRLNKAATGRGKDKSDLRQLPDHDSHALSASAGAPKVSTKRKRPPR
jgi:hypothetical protein